MSSNIFSFKPYMLKEIEKHGAVLDKVIASFDDCGDVISLFFEEVGDLNLSGQNMYWDRKRELLDAFLKSNISSIISKELGEQSEKDLKLYNLLDIHEFEGSIAGKLFYGGVYEKPCNSINEARELSHQLINEVFPDASRSIDVFKFTDGWSEFHHSAISWGYVVRESRQKLWWLFCFASTS